MSLKGIRKSDGTAEYIYADDTLSEENAPGEAKAAGDRIAGVEGRVTTLETAAPEIISNATKAWLDDNVTPTGSAVAIDSSLTQSGLAADAKAAGDAVNDLKSDFNMGRVEITKATTWSSGYVDTSGVAKASTLSGYAVVPMQAGETVVVGTQNSNITIIGSTESESVAVGDSVTVIQKTSTINRYEEYSYTATSDINIVISVLLSNYNLHFYNKLVHTDTNLTQSGVSADAKAVGERLVGVETTQGMVTAQLELKEAVNVWDTSKKANGYTATNGTFSSSASYQTLTEPIPVTEGDVVRFYKGDATSVNARFVCAYDANGNAVSASGSKSDIQTYIVPSGIVGIIPTIVSSVTNVMVTINEEPTEYSHFHAPYYVAGPNFLPDSLRSKVNIVATDTESEVITKMVNAYNAGNCDVVFERATYNFGTAITTIKTDYGLSGNNEIPVGNGCRYFFNGATLNVVIDLDTLGTDFYCNLLGVQNAVSDFELHDGILKATDTRYIVHDDAAGKAGSYKHLYQNMQLIYTTNLRTEAIRKCVGGGTGRSGVVEMVGCKFSTDGTDSAVSFHGNKTDYTGSKFILSVRDCWISNSLRAGELSENQTAKLFYANNSSGSNLQTYARWDVTAFMNEIRT